MFATACKIAAQYTHPVVAAFRRHDGQCNALFGSFVVVNREGWIVTADHIMRSIADLLESNGAYYDLAQQHETRRNDSLLSADEKQRWVEANAFPPDMITDVQLWWGGLSSTGNIANGFSLEQMDLAIGQLDGYIPPASIQYPRFKNPAHDMDVGSSLCKIGFPIFSNVLPTFDSQTGGFGFAAGVIPPALFPLDGIVTRIITYTFDEVPSFLPCLFVETSTLGLPGHSGGPLVDVDGNIWAIQSRNYYYSPGFMEAKNAAVPGASAGHQYLPLGWGIHSATVTGFLRDHRVAFELASR